MLFFEKLKVLNSRALPFKLNCDLFAKHDCIKLFFKDLLQPVNQNKQLNSTEILSPLESTLLSFRLINSTSGNCMPPENQSSLKRNLFRVASSSHIHAL